MLFDYQQYFKILCSGSLIIIALAIVLIAMDLLSYFKNWPFKFHKNIPGTVLSMFVLLFLIIMFVFPLKHGIYLFDEKENDKVQGSGTITEIAETYGNNKYVHDNQNVFAAYVYIDGEQYYIMYIGDFEVGDEVVFEYLPKSKVILSIDDNNTSP